MISNNVDYAEYLLRKGELVAIPTETVYGLAGNAFNESAVNKIFETKKRPHFNPLIVHLKSGKDLSKVARNIPKQAKQLADAFWPGPLTLVLEKKSIIPDLVTGGKNTVAVRVPNHPLTLRLLKQLNFPLVAPSANPFGKISPTSAEHVASYFESEIGLILNGGVCEKGIESTIVGFEKEQATVYRLGALSVESIEQIIGKVSVKNHESKNVPIAPGMLLKHYAPKTKLILCENPQELIQQNQGKKIGLILTQSELTNTDCVIEKLCENEDYESAAQKIYSCLHKLDQMDLELIIAEKCKPTGLGNSINDRLFRASQ